MTTGMPFRFGNFIAVKDESTGWLVNCDSLRWYRICNLAAQATEELLKEINASPLSGFKELEAELMQHAATLKQTQQKKVNNDLPKALNENMPTVYQLGACFVCKDKVMGWMISFGDGVWSSMASISTVVLKSVMTCLSNNAAVHACVPELREYLHLLINSNEQKEKIELIDEKHSEYTNVLRLAHSNVSILKSSLHKAEYELRVKSALLDFSKKTGDLSCLEVEPTGQQWCNNL